MSIRTMAELEALIRADRIVAAMIATMIATVRPAVRAGITTAELDAIAAEVLRREGARSAPHVVDGFPGTILLSVNDEAVHGVPGRRRLLPGDVLKIDVTIEKDGYIADGAVTVALEPVLPHVRALIEGTQPRSRARARGGAGGEAARGDRRRGLAGGAAPRALRPPRAHRPRRRPHDPRVAERPELPGAGRGGELEEGLVLAVEPILAVRPDSQPGAPRRPAAGAGKVVKADDGWTMRTADGSIAAHFEHTIVVTRGRPMILTAA